MAGHSSPKEAWGDPETNKEYDNIPAQHPRQSVGATTFHGTPGTPFMGSGNLQFGSTTQYNKQKFQGMCMNYKAASESQGRGDNVVVPGQSASGGSTSTWYVDQPAENQSRFPLSGLGNVRKLLELFNDGATPLLKLPKDEMAKKFATIDTKTLHSEMTNIAAMEKELVQLKQTLDSKTKLDDLQEQYKVTCSELAECKVNVAKLEKLNKQKKLNYAQDISRLQQKLYDSNNENKRLDDELKETKIRLSSLKGSKLTDGNAEIADLSDENRPTKIGEKYLELYDNQWTDAFEVLQKYAHDDRSIIESLSDILINVKLHCDGMSTSLTDGLVAAITITATTDRDTTIPSPVYKQLKDLKKMSAGVSGTKVFDLFMVKAKNLWRAPNMLSKALEEPVIKVYIKECANLCWLMCVQDPPLILDWGEKQAEKFNSNALKVYMQPGPILEYLVWPPLYLKAGGSLLAKGIAQGMQIQAKPRGNVQMPSPTHASANDKNVQRPKTAPAAQSSEQTKVKPDKARLKQTSRQ